VSLLLVTHGIEIWRFRMTKLLHAATGLTVLMMMAVAGPAATISISDLTDGMPIVQVSPDLVSVQIILSLEKAVITGLLTGIQITPGTRSVILTEPPSDPFGPFESDFLTLTIGAAAPTFSLTFESDGAANYLMDLAALPPGTPTLPETGDFQDVSTALNSGAFVILAASDLATPEVPEPDARLLLSAGLLLIYFSLNRLKRTSHSNK
jgi:hypothetical protein